MADQGTYTSNVAVADPELARRASGPSKPKRELKDVELSEKKEVDAIMSARERYGKDRQSKEREWKESYKMYMSWIDTTLNPFLSNLFIPKTHEAVELLAAFLIGSNQSISATAENGKSDTRKAQISGKWLDFLWRKILKARIKILVWIKQGIVFGNGILKVGWDNVSDNPFMAVAPIEDVYFDFFEPDIQDSEYIIHEIRRPKADVVADEKYDLKDQEGKLIRELCVEGGSSSTMEKDALFSSYDGSLRRSENEGKVLLLEVWCKSAGKEPQKLKTLLPTSEGWRLARSTDNPHKYSDGTPFRPFVKLRFKTSPVPNRAYDTGAVFPTVKIQKAFNDLINEYFDNVVLLNNKMWIKRRGARINPMDLVRRPGGVITVSDINKDLKAEEVTDIKASLVEMLNRLDVEFQQASMVVNLLKGIDQHDTATEAAIGQENVQTLLDMIDQNISDALSEAGQMLLAISLSNAEGMQSLKLYENDAEVGILEFDPKNIDGMHDVYIAPDRSASTSKVILKKQMLDFIKIVSGDQNIMARYPSLPEKAYKRYLEYDGVGDVDYFFEQDAAEAAAPVAAPAAPAKGGSPDTGALLSLPAMVRSATGAASGRV